MSGSFYGTTATVITGDDSIDGIITGHKWSSATIYYSFTSSSAVYDYDTDAGVYSAANYSVLSVQQQDAVNFALNVHFDGGGATTVASTAGFSVEGFTLRNIVHDTTPDTTSQEHIRYANTSSVLVGTARVADFSGDYITSGELDDNGDVWFNTTGDTPTAGNFDWATVLHETGHALGLKHGHTTGGTVNGTTALPAAEDSLEFSVMTYQSYIGQDRTVYNYNTTETWGAPQTYMMNDIAALQHLYGADFTTNSDDTTYSWNPGSGDTLVNGTVGIDAGGNVIFATIWDGGGTDTYDLSAYASDLTIDLAPGGWSIFDETQLADLGATGPGVGVEIARGSIFNARQYNGDARSLIENAIGGSGDDDITGNAANNTLTGNGGDDTLRGGDGNDTMRGGAGSDSMFGGDGNDTFLYLAGDEVGNTEYLSGGSGADRVYLSGAGTFSFGNSFDINSVEEIEFAAGGDLDKTLTMGSQELDVATEWLNVHIDGNNSVGSDDTIRITMNTTNLTLAGWTFEDWRSLSAGGSNTDRIYIVGNNSANTITGSSEDDIINGGAGGDTINGGDGDDLLTGGDGLDTINGDGGDDTITSDADGGTYNGGSGNDLMYSAAGAEWMDGGSGIDTIDHSAVDINYTFNMVTGATGFFFESFVNFENAIMGDGDDNVTGTAGANIIRGGLGNDTIDDGAGGDTIFGEGGDDSFLAGDSSFGDGDTWDGGDGTDTLSYQNHNWGAAVVTFDLGLGTATYNGFSETFTSIENFIGSGGNDVVAGSGGVNVISLLGGNDTLIHAVLGGDSYDGGDGNDTLRSNELWASGVHFSLLDGKLTYNNTDRDTFVGFENLEIGGSAQITGDNGNNVLTGISALANHGNVINGLGGDDTISGGGGDDTLNGGDGNDTIFGGDLNDTIDDGDGGDTVNGGDGDDLFLVGDSSFGNGDTWDGGAGTDTLSYQNYDWGTPPSAVVFDLQAGTATYNSATETFTSIERFLGSDGDETINGSTGADTIYALAGSDIISSGDGDDFVWGGAGDDTIGGGMGNDVLDGGRGADTVDGGSGDDLLGGHDGDDQISGGAGDDTIYGDDGQDEINGGAGADIIDGGIGNDTITDEDGFDAANGDVIDGGAGYDTLFSSLNWSSLVHFNLATGEGLLDGVVIDTYSNIECVSAGGQAQITGNDQANILIGLSGAAGSDNIISGGNGWDTISGGGGNDTLNGDAGNDTINGGTEDDTIDGGIGNDVLNGDEGNDTINGSWGTDTLDGGDGNDVLDGGHGKDDVFGGAGRDWIVVSTDYYGDNANGGSGIDTLDLSGWLAGLGRAVSVNLITGSYQEASNYFGADGIYTINSIENVLGTAYDDTIQGDGRRNLLRGNDGNDDVIAGGGNDRVYGGGGDDTLAGRNGNDRLYGDAGNDILNGEAGADRLTGGSGEDTLRGGAGNDVIKAGADNDILIGGNGNDTLNGGSGIDQLDGGAGRDDLQGGSGDDVLAGGGGHDVMDGGGNNDQMEGGGGDDNMSGGKGGDQMQGGSGDDTMNGDAGGDVLDGGTGNDVMDGGTGNDRLTGGSGRDTIAGGAGNDRLYGGNGNDVLDGGAGNDFLDGDAGSDKFVLMSGGGNDVIRDFVDDVDTLRLDQTLWAGTLTRQQVVDTFASIVGDDILFQFAGGESMEVRDAGALGLAAMYDDVALI